MKVALLIVRPIFGLTALFQLVVGLLFWTGHANGLVGTHQVVGSLFVLATWVMAGICARYGAPSGLVAWAIGVGALVPALGMAQMRLLPGPHHWIVRVVHLALGLATMALGGRLAGWSQRLFPRPVRPLRASSAPGA